MKQKGETMENKKRLIAANALIDKLQAHHDFLVNAWGGFSNMPKHYKARVDEITNCIAEIYNAPTIDAVEVVHGRWEHHYDNYCTLTCSECGNIYQEILFSERAKYCPNCGAKMDGERKDNET